MEGSWQVEVVCGAHVPHTSWGLSSAWAGAHRGEKLALHRHRPRPCAALFPPKATHAVTAERMQHPESQTHRAAVSEGRTCCRQRTFNI